MVEYIMYFDYIPRCLRQDLLGAIRQKENYKGLLFDDET